MTESGFFLRSPAQKQSKTTSVPKLLTVFSFKSLTENDAVASPTSTLDTKPFSVIRKPFFTETLKIQEPETRHRFDPKGIGLAIINTILDEENLEFSTRKVVFGSQLRIQIPLPSSPGSPESPVEFCLKTRNFHQGSPEKKKPDSDFTALNPDPARIFSECFSPGEMELSEDYTCVISHGPNPRRIHIFDNRIVECDYGVSRSSDPENLSGYRPENFLSCCYACKKNLGNGEDIFIDRGEKAFCSSECRHKQMMSDDINK